MCVFLIAKYDLLCDTTLMPNLHEVVIVVTRLSKSKTAVINCCKAFSKVGGVVLVMIYDAKCQCRFCDRPLAAPILFILREYLCLGYLLT